MIPGDRHTHGTMAKNIHVCTFNCNSNGANLMKWKPDPDLFPKTASIQAKAKAMIKGNTTKAVVGDFFDQYKGQNDTIDRFLVKWEGMTVEEFYTDKEIADYRLTSIIDLVCDGLYPWQTCTRPSIEDVDRIVIEKVNPIPAKYGLPEDVQRVSNLLQLYATHVLVQIMWNGLPMDLLEEAHEELKEFDKSFVYRAVTQIISYVEKSHVVLVQEMSPSIIARINATKEVNVLYVPTPGAEFYSAIVYDADAPGNKKIGEWWGDDRLVAVPMVIDGERYMIASVHGLSSSGKGTYEGILRVKTAADVEGITRVIVGGDGNTCTGASKKVEGVVVQLGSSDLRMKAESIGYHIMVPMELEPTQYATKSFLQVQGRKAGVLSSKACDFIFSTADDGAYRLIPVEGGILPSEEHVSDHKAVQTWWHWED